MTLTKQQKIVSEKVDTTKNYALKEACALVKETSYAKFDASIDLHVRLGVDPKKPDQAIRGTVSLPHGTGKTKRVLVLTTPENEEVAQKAGANFVGLDEFIQKIKDGWFDFDVVIASSNVMSKIAPIGRILGPRGLMPNPKSGTVTANVAEAVKEVKKGKIAFRTDKYGIVHASIGRASFSPKQLEENAEELIRLLARMKPASAKGTYFKSMYLAATMSPGVEIDERSISGI